jgi:hypothetical protein
LISDLFGKSSYIISKEWPATLNNYKEQGMLFFPVTFGVLETEIEGLPDSLKNFQVYYPSVSDLYKIPPSTVSNPDQTQLCYLDIDNKGAKNRFVSKLAIQMNTRFSGYAEEQEQKAREKTIASHSDSAGTQIDLSLFITETHDEDEIAKAMFGSFSFEKRFLNSNSKEHYFCRMIDKKLDASLENKDWILIEGHPLAGKTRAAFEAIKRLVSISENSLALWVFKIPESTTHELRPPFFPEVDYKIVWIDDFDAQLRDLIKRGYNTSDINLFLKKIADEELILIATARTGPAYDDFRNRFGLDDHLWDKLEPMLIDRLFGQEEKAFSRWFHEKFNKSLPRMFDHNPGSLFIDLEAMRSRWKNISSTSKSNLTINIEHAKDLLKAIHVFYVMESYKAGGMFEEKDIQYYLQKKQEYQQKKSSMGVAFSLIKLELNNPFEGNRWETLVEFLSQDKFHLGFLRREGRCLVTETAYLDYIIAPDGEKNISNTIEKIFSIVDQEKLGISITSYNFSDAFSKQYPRNTKQLNKLIRKLKPLGFEQDIHIWNQLISLCHTLKLAQLAIESLRDKGLKPNQITYLILIQNTIQSDELIQIIKEMKDDGITVDDRFYVKLIRSAPDFDIANTLITQIRKLGGNLSIHVYYQLLMKASDYLTAQKVLKDMKKEGLKPNSIAYECLLQKVHDYPTAQKVFEAMKKEGIKPNSVIYYHLLQKASDNQSVYQVFDEMKRLGINYLNSNYYYQLVRTAANYEIANKFIDEMERSSVSTNIAIYNKLLEKTEGYEDARCIFKTINNSSIIPNKESYRILLEKVTDVDVIALIHKEMVGMGICLDESDT